jgi:hypothetical protein
MKDIIFENVSFKLGENASENWSMLETEDDDYYFFHLSSFPSGYCSMQCKEPTPELLSFGAETCKNGTKYKYVKNLIIDVCKFSNLVKGELLGQVKFKSNRQVKKIRT